MNLINKYYMNGQKLFIFKAEDISEYGESHWVVNISKWSESKKEYCYEDSLSVRSYADMISCPEKRACDMFTELLDEETDDEPLGTKLDKAQIKHSLDYNSTFIFRDESNAKKAVKVLENVFYDTIK